jgi:hypothetical protein
MTRRPAAAPLAVQQLPFVLRSMRTRASSSGRSGALPRTLLPPVAGVIGAASDATTEPAGSRRPAASRTEREPSREPAARGPRPARPTPRSAESATTAGAPPGSPLSSIPPHARTAGAQLEDVAVLKRRLADAPPMKVPVLLSRS